MISYLWRNVIRAARLFSFALWFGWELVVSSLQVTWDVLTPRSRMEAGIVRLVLFSRTPLEVAGIANLVTLTPGTLAVAVTENPMTLYVHGMYTGGPEAFRADLRRREVRLLRAVRYRDRPEFGEEPR